MPLPCDAPIDESNEIGDIDFDDTEQDMQGEDCSIAEEFNTNEEHISVDLARREVEKTYKLPKLSSTPRPKAGTQGLAFLFDRKRSVTFMAAVNTKGLFNRGQFNKEPMMKSIKEQQEEPFREIVGEENVGAKIRNVKVNRIPEEKFNPTVSIMPMRLGFERMRTSSIDSYVGSAIVRKTQKENIASTRNSNVGQVPSNTKMQQELKDRFSVLLNKGPHKFSNTAQAQPKVLQKRKDVDELKVTIDYSEVLGDELTTIRTKRVDEQKR